MTREIENLTNQTDCVSSDLINAFDFYCRGMKDKTGVEDKTRIITKGKITEEKMQNKRAREE